jgi:hypothetical protein
VSGLGRRGVSHNAEPNFHLVDDLQCSEQGAERCETEIGLFEREFARDDDLITMLLVVHGHDNRASAITPAGAGSRRSDRNTISG